MKTPYLLAFTVTALAVQIASAADLAIVPKPMKMEVKQGSYTLNADTVISYNDPSAKVVAEYMAGIISASTGLKLKTEESRKAGKGILLQLAGSADSMGDEGYHIEATPDSVTASAMSPAGLFYGVQTILQLLPPEVLFKTKAENVKWEIPAVSIQDKPAFKWRGLMLDSARYFQPVEFVKKFIDIMALHKMNTLHLHLTDDQGWRIEIKKYPKLTEIGSVRAGSFRRGNAKKSDGVRYGPKFYTQAELKDIVAYAKSRFITVVPEIEMPGHEQAALSAYPALSCTGGPFSPRTVKGTDVGVYCGGSDEVFKFNEDVLAEVMDIFPSTFIHIGGDEVKKRAWNACPKCQARIKKENLKDAKGLQSYFVTRIEKFINAKGRRLIGWDEILEGGLAPNAAVMSWRGENGGIAAASEGHDVVMSPTSHCYFDYSQANGPNEPESMPKCLPMDTVYSYNPVSDKIPQDKKKHILGVQGNLWSTYMWDSAKVEYFAFPRACALAEVAWTQASEKNYAGFLTRMQQHEKRLAILNVNFRKIEKTGAEGSLIPERESRVK